MKTEWQFLMAKDSVIVAFHSVKITCWVEPKTSKPTSLRGIIANP